MALPLDVLSGPFAESAVVRAYKSFSRSHILTFQSRLQKTIYPLRKLCKLQEKRCWKFFASLLRRLPVLVIPMLPVDFSNYFPLSVGKLKDLRRMRFL